jgi:ATP/maltotriose-dependent transcriptional regulator MalT
MTRDSGDPDTLHSIAHLDANLGDVAIREGDPDTAETHLRSAMKIFAERGDGWGTAVCQRELARVAILRGELDEARALLADALSFFRRWEDRDWLAGCLEVLAELTVHRREPVRAARLAGAAAALRQTADVPLRPSDVPRLERALFPARAALGPDGWARAEAEGRAMTMDQAADHALTWARGLERPA